jgi:hypothetical protein
MRGRQVLGRILSFVGVLVGMVVVLALVVTGSIWVLDYVDDSDDRQAAREAFKNAPVPEVVVAAPSAAPPKLALSYPAGTLATAATWPKACEILTDDDVRAEVCARQPVAGSGWPAAGGRQRVAGSWRPAAGGRQLAAGTTRSALTTSRRRAWSASTNPPC